MGGGVRGTATGQSSARNSQEGTIYGREGDKLILLSNPKDQPLQLCSIFKIREYEGEA